MKSFSLKLIVSSEDIKASISVDLGEKRKNPFGLCSKLSIEEDFLVISQELEFGIGSAILTGLPNYLKLKGGFKIDEMEL